MCPAVDALRRVPEGHGIRASQAYGSGVFPTGAFHLSDSTRPSGKHPIIFPPLVLQTPYERIPTVPTWTNELPTERKHMGFDLLRTPQEKSLAAIVTSEAMTVTNTHFWGGRTVPCEMPDCEACNASVPFRSHVYVSAFDVKSHAHFIFECTAHAAKAFEDYQKAAGTLRGCYFVASRPKGTPNGRVTIATKPADLTRQPIPAAPNLILALSVIWRLPTPALREMYNVAGNSRIRTDSAASAAMRTQPDNQPDPPTIGELIAGKNGDKAVAGVLQ